MHVIDYNWDIFKDKPIDDRGVPEILFDIAAEVDQVAPLAGLGALEEEVRGGHRQERDPGRGWQALAAHAPGEAVQYNLTGVRNRPFAFRPIRGQYLGMGIS